MLRVTYSPYIKVFVKKKKSHNYLRVLNWCQLPKILYLMFYVNF